MKIYRFFLVLLCFVVSQNSFAQYPVLFEGTWVLESLTIDGEEFFPPSNDEVESIDLIFEEADDNSPHFFDTYVCNSFLSTITFEDESGMLPSFLLGDYGITLIFCDLAENEIFENQYFDFYLNAIEDPFEYIIEFLGNNPLLTVVASNGDIAIYGNPTLSASDFIKPSFSIYPNPAQDQLHIAPSQELLDYTMTIFDIHGRQLVTTSKEKLGTSPLQIQDWTSGVYLVRIEDQNGITTTKRFIKN
jgi:hypothetical protein